MRRVMAIQRKAMRCVLLASAVLLSLGLVCSAQKQKPHIVMFVVDDLGWNDVSFNGAEYETPTVDRLAKEGVRLDQYYVQMVCSPSRAAFMSGRYPFRDGLAHTVITNGVPFGLPLEHTTLADALKSAGYATHAFGKWDLGMHKWEFTPTYRGFDTFFGFYNAGEDHFTKECGQLDPREQRRYRGKDFRNGKTADESAIGGYSTTQFTAQAVSTIRSHDFTASPLFLYVAHQAVHSPLEAPDEYLSECTHIQPENRQIFCAMAKAMDESLKNITNALRTQGALDNTVLLFTTDNGGQNLQGGNNWPLRGNKGTVFEGGVRGIAFVYSDLLEKKSYINHELIHATDWLPTFVEGVAGAELNNKTFIDGHNVWKSISTGAASPRSEILIQLDPPFTPRRPREPAFIGQAAIRVGKYKLVVGQPNCSIEMVGPMNGCPDGWLTPNGTVVSPPSTYPPHHTWLFDLSSDPNEKINIASSQPSVVAELRARIDYYNTTYIDQQPPEFDPASDPDNFGGFWTPWMSDETAEKE